MSACDVGSQVQCHVLISIEIKSSKEYLFSILYRTQWWKEVPLGPPDIILGIFEDFKVDTNPKKIDLTVGAYRCNHGKPYVLTSILKAEQNIVDQRQDKTGDSDIGSEYFRDVTYRLAVGDKLFDRPHVSVQVSCLCFQTSSLVYNQDEREKRRQIFSRNNDCLFQSVSGSGSIKVAAETIGRIYKGKKLIYISNPSWAYHAPIFRQSGVETEFYRYYDPRNHQLDYTGLMTDLTVRKHF